MLGTVRDRLDRLSGVCKAPVVSVYVFLPLASKQSVDSRQFRAGRAGVAGGHWGERIQGADERVTEMGDLRVRLDAATSGRKGHENRNRP